MRSTEFLTQMKSVPDKSSVEYDSFWKNETKKAEYGLTVDGVFIHGWLYWHTQLWNIYVDEEDPINHIGKRIFRHAQFRDNEWIIAEALHEAERDRKGIMLFGSRRIGKSEFISSHIARKAVLYQGSENAATGGNWEDIDIMTSKINAGLDALPAYFKFNKLHNDPRKQIELGVKVKKPSGWESKSWSKIIVRNFDNGIKTEAAAGITASSFVIDEVGKFSFAQCFAAAKPAFTSPYGWRCVPILTGTSGDIVASSDAEKFFNTPDAFNFIVRYLKNEGGKKVSIFIDGLHRMEGKVDTTLGDYIINDKGILLPKDSPLFNVPFQTTDEAKAKAVIDDERTQAGKSPDATELLKAIMYYPLNTKELFLRDDGNNFPTEAANETIAYLLANPALQGTPCRLYRDVDTKVKISYQTDLKAIIDYPLKTNDSKEAAIIIYEPPVDNAPWYLYISGADPYNTTDSKWSNSLGSVYIYKRIYDPIAGTFQRRIVASYTARPKEGIRVFHENVEMLLELYNACCLPENEAGIFLQYFDNKNKAHYLADGYDFLREIAPKTSISSARIKGLPATVKVQRHYKELVYQYCTEQITVGHNDDGAPIKKLGIIRIPDIGLLRELVAYTNDGNFDRYVAFGHTLAHEQWADKIYPYIDTTKMRQKAEAEAKKPMPIKVSSPFKLGGSNPFAVTGSKNSFPVPKGSNPFGISK